ncbi:MAG: hypothetical protein DRR08_20965 [Candidatus Parabeggiatoa sp. nov. 2]|nr:MAG: hypothetical protein DRR08_20965 [Gammaproteobacteria bacterium]
MNSIDFQKINFFGSQQLKAKAVISRKHLLRLSESYCPLKGLNNYLKNFALKFFVCPTYPFNLSCLAALKVY